MKKTFACAVRPNKAPSMRRGLSIISLEHSYGLYGSRIFDRTQLAPKCGHVASPGGQEAWLLRGRSGQAIAILPPPSTYLLGPKTHSDPDGGGGSPPVQLVSVQYSCIYI